MEGVHTKREHDRMSPRKSALRALVLVASLTFVLPVAAPAEAGPPGEWTRLTPTRINFADVGLARTPDRVLHVIWTRTNADQSEDLMHTAISPDGRVANPDPVVAGWQSINSHTDLVATSDGRLHAFFAGLHPSREFLHPLNGPLVTASSDTGGASWSEPQPASAENRFGYVASGIGAGLGSDGSIVVAQGDSGPGYNMYRFVGASPASPDVPIETRCCLRLPDVATDARSGEVVLGWDSLISDDKGALWAQAISPTGPVGARQAAPDSASSDQRLAITGRLRAPGIFVAYRNAANSAVKLWQYGTAEPHTVAKGTDLYSVGIAQGPAGRLWTFWEDGERYFVTRTNRNATRFGAITKLAPPAGALHTTYGLFGEGSGGKLDLVAHVSLRRGSTESLADWHTQLLPALTVRVGRDGALRVTDAGDPVRRAVIRVAGRRFETNAAGRARVDLPRGRFVARVAKKGYARARVQVRIR